MQSPMVLHLYSDDGEVEKTLTQTFVPWKILKVAVKMASVLDKDTPTEEDIDAIQNLVVATFKNKCSPEELEEKADLVEMMAVLRQIVATAKNINLNPTPPGN